jgi:hypothetical protein
MEPRESTLPLRALTTEWIAFRNEGVISKCAAKMLSLVDRAGTVDGVAVPDPRGVPGAIVARVTCRPSPGSSVGCGESGLISSDGLFSASWDIVAAIVVEE